MEQNIHKYFKVGDIVRNEDIWGKQLFIVDKLFGNAYQPLLIVHPYGKPKTVGTMCNFVLSMTKLIDCPKRPLKKIPQSTLIKLLRNGNVDAKREFIMRNRK